MYVYIYIHLTVHWHTEIICMHIFVYARICVYIHQIFHIFICVNESRVVRMSHVLCRMCACICIYTSDIPHMYNQTAGACAHKRKSSNNSTLPEPVH